MASDDPQIFQIEFLEIEGFVVLRSLTYEDIELMPFDGSVLVEDLEEAQERIMWVLNTCVENLEEVKDKIKATTDDTQIQTALVLTIYQSCVTINPSVDMNLWNFLIRQRSGYHEIFKAKEFDIVDMSSIFSDALRSLWNDGEPFLPPGLPEDFLPDIPAPPWVSAKKPKKGGKQKSEDESVFHKENILTLEDYLNTYLIGQKEAVSEISKTLKRSIAGLKDDRRPLGVFMLSGSSGVGKTLSAKLIQQHLFGDNSRIVRIDCGEYQQKHESMKLLGAPQSYVGYEDGGHLTNAIKKSQNTVLLLDEAEKAHRDFWDIFLKVFDEGYITDNHGDDISFENTIIIMTSNLGNEKIAQEAFGKKTGFNVKIEDNYNSKEPPSRSYMERETLAAINKYFKPEFINRLDDIIVFNYLSEEDMEKVARLELNTVATKVNKLEMGFRWNKSAEKALALKSIKAISGAREMAKIRRTLIEDVLAHKILFEDIPKGTTFILSAKKKRGEEDYEFVIVEERPKQNIAHSKIIRNQENERNRTT